MTVALRAETTDRALPGPANEGAPALSAPSRRTMLLDDVWAASARVESLQWEMDGAEDTLLRAMRSAAEAGAQLPDLAIASGLGFADIERLLA
ncbi:hypothetical protein [Paenarthrobacter nitroguajacolicus]|uniref:hypothetical protein n=1 Tax=Paenarthrobacter nitroguajacolicus TaxID=211146 RepID=UPI00285DC6E8|nr:hypothetical protein [Paenarthrobacter nitroguajacolicus]MDR6638397.1 hypothetical protein [Paenarthrobacter nitroguajacolicus]